MRITADPQITSPDAHWRCRWAVGPAGGLLACRRSQPSADSLALGTWPAELKPQAEALYRTGRAQRLMDFVAEHPETWQARPNVQLAFRNASVAQRLYLHCSLDVTEYIHRWS